MNEVAVFNVSTDVGIISSAQPIRKLAVDLLVENLNRKTKNQPEFYEDLINLRKYTISAPNNVDSVSKPFNNISFVFTIPVDAEPRSVSDIGNMDDHEVFRRFVETYWISEKNEYGSETSDEDGGDEPLLDNWNEPFVYRSEPFDSRAELDRWNNMGLEMGLWSFFDKLLIPECQE